MSRFTLLLPLLLAACGSGSNSLTVHLSNNSTHTVTLNISGGASHPGEPTPEPTKKSATIKPGASSDVPFLTVGDDDFYSLLVDARVEHAYGGLVGLVYMQPATGAPLRCTATVVDGKGLFLVDGSLECT